MSKLIHDGLAFSFPAPKVLCSNWDCIVTRPATSMIRAGNGYFCGADCQNAQFLKLVLFAINGRERKAVAL